MKLSEAYILMEKKTKEDVDSYLPGRRRLAASIRNMLKKKEGINVPLPKIEKYLYDRCDKEEEWGKSVVAKSKALGFDPHEWFEKGSPPGYSAGQSKNRGRAYFFTVVRDLTTKHFKKEAGK